MFVLKGGLMPSDCLVDRYLDLDPNAEIDPDEVEFYADSCPCEDPILH